MMGNHEYMSPIFGKTIIYHEWRKDGIEYTVWFKLPKKHYRIAMADANGVKQSDWFDSPHGMRLDVMLPHNTQLFADTEGLDEEMYLLGVLDGVILTIVNDNAYPFYYIERVNQ